MTSVYLEDTTTLKKWGNSQAIRIPKLYLEQLGLKTDDLLNIELSQDKIIIKKTEKETEKDYFLEAFQNFKGNYSPEEVDWDSPVGREIW